MKIMRILESIWESQNNENHNIPYKNYDNHVPCDNNENIWIPFENFENHENLRIPIDNNGDYQNHRNPQVRIMKFLKMLKFN